MHRHARLLCFALPLACCAPQEAVNRVATPLGEARLAPAETPAADQGKPLPPGGEAAPVRLDVGGARVDLGGFLAADMLGFLAAGEGRVIVARGRTADCPRRYALVAVTAAGAAAAPVGACGERYAFGGDGASVFAVEIDSPDPKIWSFREGAISGPFTRSSLHPAPEPPARPRGARRRR